MLQALVFGGLFLVLFLPLYVENDFFFPFITGKNFAFRIIVEIVFASWILLALYDVKYRPKFSWILVTFAGLLGVMLVANALGEYPLKSFWSNFERMDGYVTLVHIFLYTLVLGSVMNSQKSWTYFLNTTLAVALIVAVYGLAQHSGMIEGGRARVDSRLGNAAYMAIYMLFHIFFVYLLIARSKVTTHRVVYGIIGFIFVYTLLLTGTRGTFLGLIGGTVATVVYVALFGRKYPQLRKYAAMGLFGLTALVIIFMGVRDMDFMQSGPLKRIANINIQEDLVVRTTIWSMAWEGVKERPLLGWGQGNFNYVFNEQYNPSLYGQEQWFDRVHNIFFDWLIAGGFLGFIAYFSIMGAAVYYLLIEPVFRRKESRFSVTERAVLFGLLVGYLMHNMVVFDNIISYIFYGTVLALIHSRVAKPIALVESYKIDQQLIVQFVTPIVILATGFSVYFINVAGIQAADDMIDALVTSDIQGRLESFHSALERGSFANQEIVEQLAQQAMSISRNQNISPDQKKLVVQRAELELLKMADEKPGDARVHNFLSSFYRMIGALPQANEQAALAVSFSPRKPALAIEQAVVALQENNQEEALELLKKAFELEEKNTTARILYAAVLMRTGNPDQAKELIGEEYIAEFSLNDYALSATEASGDFPFLAKLFDARIVAQPANPQHRASLAFVYYKLKDIESSVAVLTKAAVDIPDFASSAQCYIANLEEGNAPDAGCGQ